MSGKVSKNNPEARGKKNEVLKYNGKAVKPILYIKSGVGRYMAAAFEDSSLAIDKNSGLPIAYKSI